MKDFKEWIEEFAGGEKVESIEGAIEAYYRRLRKPKKPYNPVDSNGRPIVVPEEVAKFCDDVAEFASKNTNYTGTSYAAHGIKVIDDPSWSYRYLDAPRAKENESKETTLRLSLNVRPDKELIKALDALVLHDQERKFIRNYKSPSPMAWDEWARRHDPVTIYLWKKSPNMLKSVVAAIVPYVREGPELIGEKVADGVYLDQEPTVERVQSLLQRAKSAGPAVFGEISNIPTQRKEGPVLSAGQYRAITAFLDSFEKAKNDIDPASVKSYYFQKGAKRISSLAESAETVKSSNGKFYEYFVSKSGASGEYLDELRETLELLGMKAEEYKSSLYPSPVIRVAATSEAKAMASKLRDRGG